MFVRPQLEVAVQAWRPWAVKDHSNFKNIQRSATKLVRGQGYLPYETRLSNLDLFPLDYRQLRGDLAHAFRVLRGQECCLPSGDFFELATASTSRVHPLKVSVTGARRKKAFLFQQRDFGLKCLPVDSISSSIDIFKRKFNQYSLMYHCKISN
ncbi:unnamed protein product [Schistocephalus solidus]|uniref:Uncharacterized protein n=1 Tax=Schistocephalus solidus TaxID=70667 RepID=A0A183S915_SCHSO|nr:unnamed protein product [Schistocephalus solidus]